MTSKNSFSKGHFVWDIMRRNVWSMILSLVAFFMTLLLPTVMSMQHVLQQNRMLEDSDIQHIVWLIGEGNALVKIAFIVLGVTSGVVAFAYLHARQQVDLYHSLPVSRSTLFAGNFLAGLLTPAMSYLLIEVITLALAFLMGFGQAVQEAEVLRAVLINLVMLFTLMALSALTTILCGNTVIALMLLAWVLFSPTIVLVMRIGVMERFFETFSASSYDVLQALRVSPVCGYFVLGDNASYLFGTQMWVSSAFKVVLIYFAVGVAALLLGWYLFRIRRSERAGMALVFEPLKLPLKVYICLVAGTGFGLLFNLISGSFWFWPGLLIGVILLHWCVEIVYAMDFHAIFKRLWQAGAIFAVLVAGMLCMQYDVLHYDSWIPKQSDIQAVDFGSEDNSAYMMETPENIALVHQLAEIGVETMEYGNEQGVEMFYRGITYQLTGGRIRQRWYQLPMTDEVMQLIEKLKNSEEYKQKKWDLYAINPDEVRTSANTHADIYTQQSNYNVSTLRDTEQLAQLLETLQEESLTHGLYEKPLIRLEINNASLSRAYTRYYYNVWITEKDTKSLSLLKQFTGVSAQSIDPDQVESIRIEYRVDQEPAVDTGEPGSAISSWEQMEVTDRAQIATLLQDAVNVDAMNCYSSTPISADCICLANLGEINIWIENEEGSSNIGYAVDDVPELLYELTQAKGA